MGAARASSATSNEQRRCMRFSRWCQTSVSPPEVGRCDEPHTAAAEIASRSLGVDGSGLDQVEPAQLLMGLGKGAVGGLNPPVAHPDGGRGRGRLQLLADLEIAAAGEALAERPVF